MALLKKAATIAVLAGSGVMATAGMAAAAQGDNHLEQNGLVAVNALKFRKNSMADRFPRTERKAPRAASSAIRDGLFAELSPAAAGNGTTLTRSKPESAT